MQLSVPLLPMPASTLPVTAKVWQTCLKHFKTFLLLLPTLTLPESSPTTESAAKHVNTDVSCSSAESKVLLKMFRVHTPNKVIKRYTEAQIPPPFRRSLSHGVVSTLMTQTSSELHKPWGKPLYHVCVCFKPAHSSPTLYQQRTLLSIPMADLPVYANCARSTHSEGR